MADDVRISTALFHHPKYKKLRRRLGAEGCLGLVRLFAWAADNRWDGSLAGMSDEDIELAVDWFGDEGAFIQALSEVGFLDGESGNYRIHDWAVHNPFAATRGNRVEKARRAAAARWDGRDAPSMPDACNEHDLAIPEAQSSNAHHTTPPHHKDIPSNPSGSDDTDAVSSTPKTDEERAIREVFAYYLQVTDRNPKTYMLTPSRKRKGLTRLRECLKKTDGDLEKATGLMRLAVDQLCASDWHMGRDAKTGGKCYREWDSHLFGSYERMESWWNQ